MKLLAKAGFCIVVWLLVCSNILNAQPQYLGYEVYSEANGLSNNEVRCIHKDTKGYLWFGTIYGLAKYDANKFSVFKHQSQGNSISGDVVRALFEDSHGNILVGANGLSILHRETGTWQNYLHDPRDPTTISSPNITSITQDNDSIYWIIASNGLNRFNLNTGKFQHLNLQLTSRVTESKIHAITPGESLTFSVLHTLYHYNIKSNRASIVFADEKYHELDYFRGTVVGIVNTADNQHHFVRFDKDRNEDVMLLPRVGGRGKIFHDENYLYLVHQNRISVFDSSFTQVETLVFQSDSDATTLEYLSFIREESGTFWIGTTSGVVKVLPKSSFQILDSKSGLPNEYIRSLTIDSKNNLWIGVRQGPAFKIPNIDDFLTNRNKLIEPIHFPRARGEVFATNHILELANGNLIFVTNQAVYHYSTTKSMFTDQFNIPNNRQYFAAIEIPGGILVGSLEKPTLFKLNIKSDRFERDLNFRITNKPDIVYSIFIDRTGDIWVGGEGLFRLNPRDNFANPILEAAIPPISEDNYSNNSFWSITDIDEHRLIAATTTNGYYIYNKQTGEYLHYGKANGLSTDFLCTALTDLKGNVWLSTKESLTRIDTADYSINNYSIKQGQYNSDFTFKCGARTQNSYMLFGSKQGIMFFHPDSVKPTHTKSPLYVNEVRVFDNVVSSELTRGDTIRLKHNENFFSLEFSLLDYRNPRDIEYEYQLISYDRAPRSVVQNHNAVSYTNVPPGHYLFSLTSRIPSEGNSEQTIEIALIVQPAYYQTLWFKVGIALILLAGLLWIIVSAFRRKVLYGRLQKMELDMLRSQINPHFIFNTLTSIQHTIMSNSKEEAVDTLSRFSRLMRMFLDYSRLDYIPLDKALQFYSTYVTVHSVNLDEDIDFNISIDGAIDQQKVKISPMLIQPFLENAIVHGLSPKNKDMKLTLEIAMENRWLSCIVTDNGIGREKAMEIKAKKAKAHSSVGIEISSKSILLQLQKGRFIEESFTIDDNYDKEGNPTGTTVHLKIPYRTG